MVLEIRDKILRSREYGGFKGADTTSPLTAMEEGTVRSALNCHITDNGIISKRKGYENILTSSTWGSRSIRNGLEFQKNSTTKEVLVFGHQSGAGTGELGLATTSVASILGSLNNQRPSLLQFNKLVFYFNGTDDFLYDGTATRQIGITPPSSAPTGASNTNGSLTVGASYLAAYTYYNSVTGAESSPSPVSAAVVVAADPNDGITWTVTAGSATTADTIRLYRTAANGSILFLDNTAAIGATSITSTQVDAGLGAELELDNTRLATWGTVKYAEVANSRIYVAGFASPNENRVRRSKIGKSGAMPESYMATAFTDCVSSRGFFDVNVGVGVARNIPIILKLNSVGRIDELGSSNSEFGVDNTIMQYSEISRAVTCASHWAKCNVYENLVWLGRDNIYMTDGSEVTPIANKISSTIKSLNWNSPEKLSGHNNTRLKLVYFTGIVSSSGTESDIVLVGYYGNFPEFYWTFYKPGVNTTIFPGIKAGCFFDVTQSGGNQETYFGNTDLNGKLYRMNLVSNDDSLGIDFKLIGKPVDYSMPEDTKIYKKAIIYAESPDFSATTLDVGAYYDLGLSLSHLESLPITVNSAIWDSSIWDTAVWTDEGPLRVEHSSHRRAYYKQIYLANSAANQNISIHGWTDAAYQGNFK